MAASVGVIIKIEVHNIFVLECFWVYSYQHSYWVAHEENVAINAGIELTGLFDVYRWYQSMEGFEHTTIKTEDGDVATRRVVNTLATWSSSMVGIGACMRALKISGVESVGN